MEEIWNEVISNNIEKLVKCTSLNHELIVALKQDKVLPDSKLEEMLDKHTIDSNKIFALYQFVGSKIEEEKIKSFKTCLKKSGNIKALGILNAAEIAIEEKSSQLKSSPVVEVRKSGSSNSNLNLYTNLPPSEIISVLQPYEDGHRVGLIINVQVDRLGAHNDEQALYDVLGKCGFQVAICQNLTQKGIREMITQLKKELNKMGKIGVIFISLMSHGTGFDWFKTSDGLQLNLEKDIIDEFNARKCPEIKNVPKVFLVNICRGDKEDSPRTMNDSAMPSIFAPPAKYSTRQLVPTWWDNYGQSTEKDSEPTWKHMLICHASYIDHVAYRETDEGTWFVQAFCNAVKKYANGKIDIEDILKFVSEDVSQKSTEQGGKQIPNYKNVGFNKKLYLTYVN